MKWVVIILIILVVVLVAGLIWSAARRKKEQQARARADELRSDAAGTAAGHAEQEARAREAKAEADRVRAQADQLEAQASQEQRSFDMNRAQEEDRLREADRIDPEVDHTAPDYQPGTAHATSADGEHAASTNGTGTTGEADLAHPRTAGDYAADGSTDAAAENPQAGRHQA